MTEEQRKAAIEEANKAAAKEIKERKSAEIKAGFLNPFGEKTSYAEFLTEVEKAKKSIADYCKGKITSDKIEWLEKEVSLLNTEK